MVAPGRVLMTSCVTGVPGGAVDGGHATNFVRLRAVNCHWRHVNLAAVLARLSEPSISTLGSRGIKIFLDWHQDSFLKGRLPGLADQHLEEECIFPDLLISISGKKASS